MTKETRVTVTGRYVGGGLFTPRKDPQNPERDPRHSACIVLDKGQDKIVSGAVEAALTDRWGNKMPSGLQDWGVREGDDEEYEASYGKKFINPKSNKCPKVLKRTMGSVYVDVDEKDDVVYPGCYVAVSIDAYAYEGDKKNGIKPGVTLNLRSVLFRKDGDRLDDYVDAESEFEGVEVDDTEDEDDFLAA